MVTQKKSMPFERIREFSRAAEKSTKPHSTNLLETTLGTSREGLFDLTPALTPQPLTPGP
jgi:hypothetical protein